MALSLHTPALRSKVNTPPLAAARGTHFRREHLELSVGRHGRHAPSSACRAPHPSQEAPCRHQAFATTPSSIASSPASLKAVRSAKSAGKTACPIAAPYSAGARATTTWPRASWRRGKSASMTGPNAPSKPRERAKTPSRAASLSTLKGGSWASFPTPSPINQSRWGSV